MTSISVTANANLIADTVVEPVSGASAATQAGSKLLAVVPTVEAAHADDLPITTRTRGEYVSLFRTFEEKTARSTLEMCRAVYEAHKMLNEAEFDAFCSDIGYKDTSSSIRKFIAIGKVMPRMIKFAEKLPASWTTIYMLTQIPASVFESMMKQGKVFRDIKNSDLTKLVKETRDTRSITAHLPRDKETSQIQFAKVTFTKCPVDDIDWRAMRKAFAELESRLPIRFTVDKRAEEAWEARKNEMYEDTKVRFVKEELRPDTWDFGREAAAVAKRKLPVTDSKPAHAAAPLTTSSSEPQAA